MAEDYFCEECGTEMAEKDAHSYVCMDCFFDSIPDSGIRICKCGGTSWKIFDKVLDKEGKIIPDHAECVSCGEWW